MAQFKRGDFSTCDVLRPGRPKTVTTPEIIDQISQLISEDGRISAKSIAEQLGISRERVGSIIHEDLDMRSSIGLCLKIVMLQSTATGIKMNLAWIILILVKTLLSFHVAKRRRIYYVKSNADYSVISMALGLIDCTLRRKI